MNWKIDSRGKLLEAFKFKDGQIFVVEINPGQGRGNHYHTRKIESFLVIKGSCTAYLKDLKSGLVVKEELSEESPKVLTVTPQINHRFQTEDGCTLLVFANEVFDVKDADTYTLEED